MRCTAIRLARELGRYLEALTVRLSE